MIKYENQLPATTGSYGLILELAQTQQITVGALAQQNFPVGIYIYLGSARGPGGVRGRLGRHVRGGAKQHWHIDYLRARADVVGYYYRPEEKRRAATPPAECRWSQACAGLSQAQIPVPGFGARDCQYGCPAHLVWFPRQAAHELRQYLQRQNFPVFFWPE